MVKRLASHLIEVGYRRTCVRWIRGHAEMRAVPMAEPESPVVIAIRRAADLASVEGAGAVLAPHFAEAAAARARA